MELPLRFLGYLILLCCLLRHTKAITPVFTAYTPGPITEGLPPGSPYYTFIATDATPGHVVTYSLESKALEWFNINSTSGVATVKKTIDREVMTSLFRYKVYASDGTNTAEEDVNQRILDINDNPPVFSNLPRNISVNEDFPVGSLVFTATATDTDLPPANLMEFTIEAGNEAGIFEFPNAAEGKINLKKPLDYDDGTRQFLLRIIAKNTQDPKLNSTAVLTINVQNVDDLGAKFEKNFYEATAIKDSLPGTVVTTVQAKDEDRLNATVEYNIYQETNPGNTYKVNNNTGEITVNGPLTIGTQLLVVTATSTKHPPAFTVVKITVASMINMSYTVNVVEEQSNVVIFNLEPAERFYNISGGNFSIIPSAQSDLFSIEGKDLKIGPTALDRETQGQYQLNIAVNKGSTRKGIVMVTINVLDINDNKPLFRGDLPYNATVKEDVDVGYSILRVTATDVDDGLNGTVKYAITGGDRPDLFSMDNETGMITVAASLDRETTAQFILTVQAYDGGFPAMTNITNVIINVKDVNDNAPIFNDTSISKTIPEWATNGTEVAVVSATDKDSGDNGKITYVIQEGADGKFVIDPNSGVITTTGGLSYSTKPSYTLTVIASDNGSPPRSATAVVQVTIKPRTNMSYTEQVDEGAANVAVLNLTGVDQVYGVSGATFSLTSGNVDNLFVVDAPNEMLKVGSQPLDRELRSEYLLQMQVEKDGITRGTAMITVQVLDINDNSPSFQGSIPYYVNIKENVDAGTNVLKVQATDSDSGLNGIVKYAITTGNNQGLFSIDNTTGQISLMAGNLDRESTAQFTLTVQAYDGGFPSLTNTTNVVINVQDINDNSPVFNQTSFTKALSEWATNGTEVAVVSATDKDSGDNGKITYAIQGGADGKFVIDSNSGVITTTGGLSYSTKPSYTLTVIASDNGSSPRSATAVVQVTIKPRTNMSYTEQVDEGAANVAVLNLTGVDQVYGVSGATFSLTSGNVDNLFVVDAPNEVLKVGSQPLDRELRSEYQLQMQVEKDGITRGTAMITVQVLDVNDNSPSFQGSIPYYVNIKENVDAGTNVLKVQATDSDSGLNGIVKYAIIAGNNQGLFSIDNTTGQISLMAGNLDRESTAQFTLTVQAYDGGFPSLTNTTNVVINVQDINDNSPVFNQTSFTKALSEWATNGTEVAVVSATDKDSGDNGKITYVIQEGADGKFVIDPNSGVITTTGGLSYSTKPSYTIIVKASDHGSSPRSATAVVSVSVEPKTNKTYTVHVTENTPNEIVMNLQIVEQDYNATGANLSISSGNSDGHFEINAATKDLKVGTNPPDREIKDVYVLRVTLVKDGIVRGVAMIIVNVLDVNDNSPAFQGPIPYNIDVKEDLNVGNIILKVTATDGDSGANGTVRYAITDGNQLGHFFINNITGEISLKEKLNREDTTQFNLTIKASDGGSSPMASSTNVVINVQDVNDNSPSFKPSRVFNVTISENTAVRNEIARLVANDLDIGENSRISYSIEDGAYGDFDINNTTGAIETSRDLSFKKRPKYTLLVDAKDNGEPSRSASAVVHITITSAAVNQYPPDFTKNEYLGGVYKDTSDDQVVLTITATDDDSGVNGEVVYELTHNPAQYYFYLETVSGRLRSANSFVDKEGEIYIFKAVARDKGTPVKNSTNATLCVFVLRDSHSLVITADVTQDFILKNIDEFRSALDDLTGGNAFIKSVRPKEGQQGSSEIVVNVVKDKNELTSAQIEDTMTQKEDDMKSKYSKWKIRTYEQPKTGQQISAGGLSAIVGAMICLALLIGVGGIIMIIILIKKRRERERIRKNVRVTFSDEPHYINIDGNLPVSRLREVESAQEAREGYTNMGDETSSVGSEDVQTSPDVMNYFNDAYHDDEHDEHEQKDGFVNNSDAPNFGTFFPPPPTEPPPPVPDSDNGSLASEEESINSEEDEPEPDYINAVLPPHEDFADNPNPPIAEEHNADSPTHSHTDSTSQLIGSDSYKDDLLHDHDFGFGALRRSSNPELTTEL